MPFPAQRYLSYNYIFSSLIIRLLIISITIRELSLTIMMLSSQIQQGLLNKI